jgi:hypothetical protein
LIFRNLYTSPKPVTLSETIVRRRCAALIRYARNACTHSDQQVAQIAASIREDLVLTGQRR